VIASRQVALAQLGDRDPRRHLDIDRPGGVLRRRVGPPLRLCAQPENRNGKADLDAIESHRVSSRRLLHEVKNDGAAAPFGAPQAPRV
jgi:hypothetical protein